MRILLLALSLGALPAAAQDTLTLPELHDAALARDPRTRQAALQAEATRLRLRSIRAERLPQVGLRAEATHQSEVAALPLTLPGGATPPEPPADRVEAALEASVLLYDGGLGTRRRAAEEAQLEVTRAQLAATLFPLRAEVNESFFAAYLLQERLRETATLVEDLEARLATVRSLVRGGAALPGDTAALLAAILRAEQDRAQLAADRRAALSVLRQLTGRSLSGHDRLVLPDLDAVLATGGVGRPGHPQLAVFAAQRARLERDARLVGARVRPQVSAFGQLAYGTPGLAQFDRDPHEYWLAGVRLRWSPWDWGSTRREREIIRMQQLVLSVEEMAFADRLQRQVADESETITRLREAIAVDERIIALRAQVERQAAAQLAERAITADRYVDARTDLQEARVARDRHRAELVRAQAQYLTTLGRDLR